MEQPLQLRSVTSCGVAFRSAGVVGEVLFGNGPPFAKKTSPDFLASVQFDNIILRRDQNNKHVRRHLHVQCVYPHKNI